MSSASRETQPFEENINLPSCSIFLKTQKYFLLVSDNQVSTVFCVINSRKPAFESPADTKDRDFSLSYCFLLRGGGVSQSRNPSVLSLIQVSASVFASLLHLELDRRC